MNFDPAHSPPIKSHLRDFGRSKNRFKFAAMHQNINEPRALPWPQPMAALLG